MGYISVCHTWSCSRHGIDYTENLRSTKNKSKKSLRQLFQVTQKLITDQTENTGLIGGSVRGERRLCWLTELFSLQLPKPTSLLTQRYVREVSVLNQSRHGKPGSIGFLKHVISKIWIESTGSRWSSSGKSSQDSPHWEFSLRFRRWWMNQSVNQSNSKEGSSSCQCTVTLIGQNEETKNIVLRSLGEALGVAEYVRRFMQGHWSFLESWSEKKWYGTHVKKRDGEWD